MVCKVAAFHTDGVDFLNLFRNGHKGRHRAEGIAKVIHIKARHYHAHSPVGKGLDHLHQGVVKKLGLVYAHYADIGVHQENVSCAVDWDGRDGLEVV